MSLFFCAVPAGAATSNTFHAHHPSNRTANHRTGKSSQRPINWDRRDTAIYVISTVNLLRTADGQPISRLLAIRMSAARFDVYSDQQDEELYFIEVKRDNGTSAGALAYRMGWLKPQSLTGSIAKLGVSRATDTIVQAYRSDPKSLMASFTSTLPQ